MKDLTLDSLASLLKSYKNKKIALTFHSIGDTDSVASAFALSKYFMNSVVITPNIITTNARRMLTRLGYSAKLQTEIPRDAALIIILDTNNLDSLEGLSQEILKREALKLFIDHHTYPSQQYPRASIFNDENYNSTSGIIYSVLAKLGMELDRTSAEMLLYGIVSDSADFQNANSVTFSQVSSLLEISKRSYQEIYKNLEEHVPANIRYQAINDLYSSKMEIIKDFILVYGASTTHANAVAEKAIKMGADAAVFWAVTSKEATMSARLRAPLDQELPMHLGKIMQKIAPLLAGSGGGHPCAAGAYGPNKEGIGSAQKEVLKEIREKLSG